MLIRLGGEKDKIRTSLWQDQIHSSMPWKKNQSLLLVSYMPLQMVGEATEINMKWLYDLCRVGNFLINQVCIFLFYSDLKWHFQYMYIHKMVTCNNGKTSSEKNVTCFEWESNPHPSFSCSNEIPPHYRDNPASCTVI